MNDHSVTVDSDLALPNGFDPDLIPALVAFVLQQEEVGEDWTVGIQFVDDAEMQRAHLEFMDIDEPTDIMTFPYEEDDDEWGASDPGGDLMISVDRAKVNATEAGWSAAEELAFLIAHGLLHLTGWDDHTDEDRDAMLARQHTLLSAWRESLG